MPVNSFEDYPMSWKPTLNHAVKPLYLFPGPAVRAGYQKGQPAAGDEAPAAAGTGRFSGY